MKKLKKIHVKVNAAPQPCPYRAECIGACEWCETNSYSEACVPLLQSRCKVLGERWLACENKLSHRRETPTGCEYCAGETKLYQRTNNTKLYINTLGRARTIETECMPCPPYSKCCMNGIPARSAFLIKYCPHCGRKLDTAE